MSTRKKVLSNDEWSQPNLADITKHVNEGRNQISMVAQNQGGPAGALAVLLFKTQDGSVIEVVTDRSWKTSISESKGWLGASYDDSQWRMLRDRSFRRENLPWSGSVNRDAIASMLGGEQNGEFTLKSLRMRKYQKASKSNAFSAFRKRWVLGLLLQPITKVD